MLGLNPLLPSGETKTEEEGVEEPTVDFLPVLSLARILSQPSPGVSKDVPCGEWKCDDAVKISSTLDEASASSCSSSTSLLSSLSLSSKAPDLLVSLPPKSILLPLPFPLNSLANRLFIPGILHLFCATVLRCLKYSESMILWRSWPPFMKASKVFFLRKALAISWKGMTAAKESPEEASTAVSFILLVIRSSKSS